MQQFKYNTQMKKTQKPPLFSISQRVNVNFFDRSTRRNSERESETKAKIKETLSLSIFQLILCVVDFWTTTGSKKYYS